MLQTNLAHSIAVPLVSWQKMALSNRHRAFEKKLE
jgi:hypothetical protein